MTKVTIEAEEMSLTIFWSKAIVGIFIDVVPPDIDVYRSTGNESSKLTLVLVLVSMNPIPENLIKINKCV